MRCHAALFLPALVLAAAAACGTTTTTKPDDTASTAPTGEPTAEEDRDGDGWTLSSGDCNDEDPEISPSANEVACDGVDNDCADGDLDDGDGDGYACLDAGGGDCDDTNPSIYPGSFDACYDGIDADCRGDDDDDCDQDGYASADHGGDDCNDADPEIHPNEIEVCWDGVDNDCNLDTPDCDCDGDGVDGTECGGTDCEDTMPEVYPGAKDVCYDGIDMDCGGEDDGDCDGDGHVAIELGGDDCDDTDPTISPSEPDVCHDGIDNDCNPSTGDCDCDGDGSDELACGGDDCDDANPDIFPGASEAVADDLDNDCDEEVDEDAYCHPYFPMSNGASAERVYDGYMYDGSYSETVTITGYDPATGNGTVHRDLGTFTVDELVRCNAAGVIQTEVTSDHPLWAGTVTYSSSRMLLQQPGALTVGTTWSYSYDANYLGLFAAYSAQGTYRVEGFDTITVGAGTFDVIVITNDYVVQDGLLAGYARSGVATLWYAERLGVVQAYDIDDFGGLWEDRELTSYTDYFP